MPTPIRRRLISRASAGTTPAAANCEKRAQGVAYMTFIENQKPPQKSNDPAVTELSGESQI